VRPFNSGVGFSGAEDFNLCWLDALNLYERGEATHFAMLHGDIEPDPAQHWLDVLMEELDARHAAIVSAHVPIKDLKGVCSCGIGDPSNPWAAWRRFTQNEILNDLPQTFNNVLAGYPDKPLLVNTGCWVADLRNPIFHETTEDGSLKTMFKFPERIIRGPDGSWVHQRESEDWCLSRELWERGCTDLWVTSRVRLTHRGGFLWPNQGEFGKYKNGDESTAAKWRQAETEKPLSLLQMLEFELGGKCNLGHVHHECPNMHPDRYGELDTSRELDDDTIVSAAVQAYQHLGFTGLVGWIYYNEPLLQMERMFSLMERIKDEAPKARFILWTNGTLIPEDCERFRLFEQIVVSQYNEQSTLGIGRLASLNIPCKVIRDAQLDNRCYLPTNEETQTPCLRPFVELIIDNHGNSHLCCYDWQGSGTLGNVFDDGFAAIVTRWRDALPEISGHTMTEDAPEVCRGCAHKWDQYQCHDNQIVERAKLWRAGLPVPETVS